MAPKQRGAAAASSSKTGSKRAKTPKSPKAALARAQTRAQTGMQTGARTGANTGASGHLVVVADPAGPVAAWLQRIVEVAEGPVVLSLCPDLAAARAVAPRGAIFVPLATAPRAIAAAITAGLPPVAACAAWARDTRDLLRSCKASARIVLLDEAALLAANPASLTLLQDHLSVDPALLRKMAKAFAKEARTPDMQALAVAHLAYGCDGKARAQGAALEVALRGPVHEQGVDAAAIDALAEGAPGGSAAREVPLLRESLEELLADIETLNAENAAQAEQIATLQSDAAERHMAAAFSSALESKLAGLERAAEHREAVLGAQILRDRSALDAAQADLTGARSQITDLEYSQATARAEAREAFETLQKAHRLLEDEKSGLRATLDKLETQHADLTRAHTDLRGERDGLRAELERIFASKSWKVTAPMRGVRRKMSKPED